MKEKDTLLSTMTPTTDGGSISTFIDPAIPSPPSLSQQIMKFMIFSLIGIFLVIPVLTYLFITKWNIMYSTLKKAIVPSIKDTKAYKDTELLHRLRQSAMGSLYQSAVEFQFQEGYCCPATQRTILKSLPGLNHSLLADPKRGPATIEKFAETLDEQSQGMTKSSIALGSEGYETFLAALKKVNNPKYRVAANFLRSPLFGFVRSIWPSSLMLTFLGGHFSPIVGFFEDLNLVAVFDVNHNYSTFFVTPERFYDAVGMSVQI